MNNTRWEPGQARKEKNEITLGEGNGKTTTHWLQAAGQAVRAEIKECDPKLCSRSLLLVLQLLLSPSISRRWVFPEINRKTLTLTSHAPTPLTHPLH